MTKFLFQHFLWHELGHFYAIHHECPSNNLHRFNDQALSEEKANQEGYWFWLNIPDPGIHAGETNGKRAFLGNQRKLAGEDWAEDCGYGE